MRKYLLIIVFALVLLICPRVNALSTSGNATVGRSAVMDTSSNYYYTSWTSLSSNSLNSVPIPTSQGNYYHMGSEYVMAVALNGETSCNGSIRVPVVSNTIYNYTLMNGLNDNDLKLGFNQNFGVYDNVSLTSWNMAWECQVYPHLGVAHNYCYYDTSFSFIIDQPLTGSYNFNFAVFNTTGNRSAWYYDGYDSTGNAIEFPVSASNSGYANLAPTVRLNCSSGSGSSSTDTEEIIGSITESTTVLQETIQESYENLVKSQEVCSSYDYSMFSNNVGYIRNNNIVDSNSFNYSSYINIYNSSINVYDILDDNYRQFCTYGSDKSLIGCYGMNQFTNDFNFSNVYYIRVSFTKNVNKPQFTICQNGNQAIYDFMNEPFDGSGIGADITDVQWYENSYFSSLITSPIAFLSSLSESCSPITLTLFGHDVVLPCGTTIFWELNSSYIQNFRTFWNIIFAGLIIYRLALQLILTVNDCLDPTKDSVGGFKI